MLHLTKTKMLLVIWLNIVTVVARSVRLLPAYNGKDVHATRQLHFQWWSGQCHAKHAENVKLSAIYKEYLTGIRN